MSTRRRSAGARVPLGRRALAERFSASFDVSAQFLVQVLTHSPELLDERIVGPCINAVGREHTGITSGRLHLGLQPLKILTRIGRIGKRIDRLFQWNRADLLEPAPGRDSEVGGVRRKLVDEQQPATTVWRRRREWQLIGLERLNRAWPDHRFTDVTFVSQYMISVTVVNASLDGTVRGANRSTATPSWAVNDSVEELVRSSRRRTSSGARTPGHFQEK